MRTLARLADYVTFRGRIVSGRRIDRSRHLVDVFRGTIGPLTNPTAHGSSAEDAFDVVIPSMPGYGFSGKPSDTGWGPERIARTWVELMKRLGYAHYVGQGGDRGSPVSSGQESHP